MVYSHRLHLSSIWLVHQEDLTPDLDPGGLPLWAPPPGEAGQRLVCISEPAFRCLSTIGLEVLVEWFNYLLYFLIKCGKYPEPYNPDKIEFLWDNKITEYEQNIRHWQPNYKISGTSFGQTPIYKSQNAVITFKVYLWTLQIAQN